MAGCRPIFVFTHKMVVDAQTQERIEVWKARAQLFKQREIKVHIKLADGKYLKGVILRFFNDGFDVDDTDLGEYPVLYSELRQFDKFREFAQ